MKKLKIVFAVILFTSIISCKKEPVEEPALDCDMNGTFELVECGSGYFDNYFIRLGDGTLIQPADCKINFNKEQVYNGMQVRLSYTIANEETQYTMISSCINNEATKAVITCISNIQRPMWCGTK